jgi:hypothetical protein
LRIVPLISRFVSTTAFGHFGAFLILLLTDGFDLFSDIAEDSRGLFIRVAVANPIDDGKRFLAFRFELGGYESPAS